MNYKHFISFGSLILLLTACASLNGTATPDKISGKAVVFINNSIVNVPKASGSIRNVDGNIKSTYWSSSQPNQVVIDQGRHSIEVGFYSNGYGADATVNGDFTNDHVYEISATKDRGSTFKVILEDLTESKHKVIYETNATGIPGP